MHIACSHCGAEIEKDDALTSEEDGVVYFFCSPDCLEDYEYVPLPDGDEEREG